MSNRDFSGEKMTSRIFTVVLCKLNEGFPENLEGFPEDLEIGYQHASASTSTSTSTST